ncbi:MAG: DUF58 domain-containing protein [Phototrophicaceae bacterium]
MAMIEAETLRRIRRLEMRTRRLVNESFAGAYHSVFKGRGLAFEAVRPYQPGDDVRDIDWNVTARSDEAYVKRFAEERELTVMLVLDTSASCLFGTVNRQKRDLAAEIGAVLALSAVSNNDNVGLLVFSDRVEQFVRPRKGRNHVLRIIRDLLAVRPAQQGTDLSLALRTVNRALRKRAIIFLMSDFLLNPQEYARELVATSRRHDVIALVLSDPRERRWPDAGLVALRDAETAAAYRVDTGSARWRRRFEQQARRFGQMRDATLTQAGADRIDLPVDVDYVQALTQFFQRRAQRLKR